MDKVSDTCISSHECQPNSFRPRSKRRKQRKTSNSTSRSNTKLVTFLSLSILTLSFFITPSNSSLTEECIGFIVESTNTTIPPDSNSTYPELLYEAGYIGNICGLDYGLIRKQNERVLGPDFDKSDHDDDMDKICRETIVQDPKTKRLQRVLEVISYITITIIMFGMGCASQFEQMRRALTKPYGVCVGFLCQFLIMPCLAIGLIKILDDDLPPYQKIVVLLLGASPGGSFSNILAMTTGNDIDLSITMTMCSTIFSLGMIPLLLWLIVPVIESSEDEIDLDVPFDSIGVTLALMIGPIFFGMIVRGFFVIKYAHCKFIKLACKLRFVSFA